MKKGLLLCLLLMPSILFSDMYDVLVIDFYMGDVTVSQDNGESFSPVSFDTALKSGDIVKTGNDSYCDIQIKKGFIRITPDSIVDLNIINDKKEDVISIKKGKAVFQLNVVSKNSLKVKTESAYAAVRGTIFTVYADENSSYIGNIDGKVNASKNVNMEKLKDELETKLEEVKKNSKQSNLERDEEYVFYKRLLDYIARSGKRNEVYLGRSKKVDIGNEKTKALIDTLENKIKNAIDEYYAKPKDYKKILASINTHIIKTLKDDASQMKSSITTYSEADTIIKSLDNVRKEATGEESDIKDEIERYNDIYTPSPSSSSSSSSGEAPQPASTSSHPH